MRVFTTSAAKEQFQKYRQFNNLFFIQPATRRDKMLKFFINMTQVFVTFAIARAFCSF
jgi:hypothetical protein